MMGVVVELVGVMEFVDSVFRKLVIEEEELK